MVDWLRAHLLVSLSLFAGVLLVLGAYVIIESAPVPSAQSAQIWSGEGNAPVAPTYSGNPVLTALPEPALNQDISPAFLPIAPKAPLGDTQTTGDQTDLASLLASLVASDKGAARSASSSVPTAVGYDFIPQGLISTSSYTVHRSGVVQELYDYGNEVGSYIQSYENANAGAAVILKNQVEDRQDPAKGQAVRQLGISLAKIGVSMEKMDQVPKSVGTLHKNLAKSYEDAGTKLAAVPDAQGDQAFIAAIEAYDAAADTLTQNFVTMATFFSVSQVNFTQDDSGSVFSFTPGGAL